MPRLLLRAALLCAYNSRIFSTMLRFMILLIARLMAAMQHAQHTPAHSSIPAEAMTISEYESDRTAVSIAQPAAAAANPHRTE